MAVVGEELVCDSYPNTDRDRHTVAVIMNMKTAAYDREDCSI